MGNTPAISLASTHLGDTARAMLPEEETQAFVERGLVGLNARDVEAVMAKTDPPLEFVSRLVSVEGRPYLGREGLAEFFADVDGAFKGVRWTLEEIVGWQREDLVVVARFRARGHESGAPIDMPSFQVWSFRNGKVGQLVVYPSRGEALADGLKE